MRENVQRTFNYIHTELLKTTTSLCLVGYISALPSEEGNLPGTEDTVIKQAVPPGGDSALHLALLKLAIAQTG